MNERASFRAARRVVIKVGSSLLASEPEALTSAVADEVRDLAARGVACVVVSSGAIAFGVADLKLKQRPRTLPGLQAAAAVGQSRLVGEWSRAFAAHRIPVGQVLLTHDDVRSRGRYLNARHTLLALVELGVVPIINENDTVSVDEIKFGDNDRLAALVCSLVEADLLLLLTDVKGLYDGDPSAGGRLITEVRDIDSEAAPVAGGSISGVGTGGMASKVEAARIAGRFGVPTVVSSGRRPNPITPIVDGDSIGTVFWPSLTRLQSRKHWIAYALKPAGVLTVDGGAKEALVERGRSLLPSGIAAVSGNFEAGEAVSIRDLEGREFARGLTAYAAEEVARIRGRQSADVETILGYRSLDEVVHRDDLVIL